METTECLHVFFQEKTGYFRKLKSYDTRVAMKVDMEREISLACECRNLTNKILQKTVSPVSEDNPMQNIPYMIILMGKNYKIVSLYISKITKTSKS